MDADFETIDESQILEPKKRLRQLRLPVEKVKTVEVEHPESGRAVINVTDLADYENRGWLQVTDEPTEESGEEAPAEEAPQPTKKSKKK